MTTKIRYKIRGGTPIIGNIQCLGAKNLATKVMLASMLGSTESTLWNMPYIGDVEITRKMIEMTGADVKFDRDDNSHFGKVTIDPRSISKAIVVLPDSATNRIPILLLSVLLQLFDEVEVPTITGDEIGKRKVDFHVEAIRMFNGEVEVGNNCFRARKNHKLSGTHFTLPYPSVGATETCLFLAVLADGMSVIKNIAMEPEIMHLISMLRCMGAVIFINPNRELIVHGVKQLKGVNFHVIGDRIEAVSWALLACTVRGSDITLQGINPELLGIFLSYLNMAGGRFEILSENSIRFYSEYNSVISPLVLETDVYPGFSTDWQQPFTVMLTQARGTSVVHETVYENRLGYTDMLNQLGADISIFHSCLGSSNCRYRGYYHPHSAIVKGKTELHALKEPIVVPDIRAGLAYLIAAVLAKGDTILDDADKLERGYGNIPQRLKNTTLEITREQ
ncbi:UDP-N-acetylglucosamine 1-carboxyvinyltransferase 2 [Candidatus Fokinia solitaria]|uniref:UDP-N-acetylglucosamine 1-carboxyvinyltransferase n=1 Tax=Candidatus Fokinia solitaria TaxID=1802984 RepID=A0A2U8BSV8_9RICK|nr:UDP-N-acetylglucosamine 1-carboxyvinyltransferase [Candidatus Fokinia solitaria]AWD33395.1 UDP-N-acetylglucosamine 1-carboxyvinyltransferase 2 [Candidatus Fokinia solitaria]